MMDKPRIVLRRAAALFGAVLLFAALAAPGAAIAQQASAPYAGAAAAQLRFRAIKIDVSPLVGMGLGPEAQWLSQDLPARLQAAFAGRIAPRDAAAPILVVRIDQVYLGESGGGGSTAPLGDYGARDGIQGVAMVTARNGKVLASYPLFTTQLALTGGSVYDMQSARGRVADLAGNFAQWLPGQMGL
jgi:hypothetical protein